MSTKYQAVADALRAHIQAGKYAGAAVLPSEFAIAEEYQVSRQTVRQALSLLAQDGLIETKRGSGSHIPPPATIILLSLSPISATTFSPAFCGR